VFRLVVFLLSRDVVPALSAVPACGDYDGVAAAGADDAGLRVVREHGTQGSELVDEVHGLGGAGDLRGAVALRMAVVGEQDGDGRQVRQDPVLAYVGVPGPAGSVPAALV
jgi:hypothetical protein